MKRNHFSANLSRPLDSAPQPKLGWTGRVSLALLCLCPTCKQAAPSDTLAQPSASPAAASAASDPSVASGAPDAKPAAASRATSSCAGKYQGEYTVASIKTELTKKEGAPEQWKKDDGKTLAGKGTLALQVDSADVVSGSAEGALGQQTLRGACDENTLRVQLDSTVDDPSKIRNAYLVAGVSGSEASGTLTAATGDSLIRRAGSVTLHRVP
jgi:hypothetical protein